MYGGQLKKILKKVPRVRYLTVTQQWAKTYELSLVYFMRWTAFATTDYSFWTCFGQLIWISESFTYWLPICWGSMQTSVWNCWNQRGCLPQVYDDELGFWQESLTLPWHTHKFNMCEKENWRRLVELPWIRGPTDLILNSPSWNDISSFTWHV